MSRTLEVTLEDETAPELSCTCGGLPPITSYLQTQNLKPECHTAWPLRPPGGSCTHDTGFTASGAEKLPVTAGKGHRAQTSLEEQISKRVLKRNTSQVTCPAGLSFSAEQTRSLANAPIGSPLVSSK